METAYKTEQLAAAQYNEKQIELAKERTQYFEKLALGSGATIAAVVSFIGTHLGRLRPPLLLRSTLVILVVAMLAAMARNWFYPRYVLATFLREYDEALLEREKTRAGYFSAGPALSLQDGKPIDVQGWLAHHEQIKPILNLKISQFEAESEHWLKLIKVLELICLGASGLAIASLVLLAWINF